MVFTSLSIISLIARPLAFLISTLQSLMASLGSFERIQAFLEQSTSLSTEKFTNHRSVQSSDDVELHFTPFSTSRLELREMPQ
ncbi:hypothetical protein LX36DRAFT_358414 [Colletotrichum falcatum]|nr:hypothetical protein LX36DRAFT_358414 [Colletotrichum falcatum]